MTTKPLIIAHRGASGIEPENTMRAFEAAYQAGADGLELDIFLSKDKVIVVTHDQKSHRLTPENWDVRKTTLQKLKTLDYGKGEKIPTLEEVFEAFLSKFKIINVEIKSTGFRTDGIEKKLAHLVKKFNCHEKLLISSFNPIHIYRFRKLMTKVKIGYLIAPHDHISQYHFHTIRWLKPDTLNLHPTLVNHKQTQNFFELGIPIWMWSIDSEPEWQYWIDQGVEALITDHPGRLFEMINLGKRK